MSDKEKKRLAIGLGIIAVLVLLYFLFRKGPNVVRQERGALSPFQPGDIQNLNFSRQPFSLPPFNLGDRWQGLSAIGACCSDCSGSAPRRQTATPVTRGLTLVFNEGSRGANYYDYRTFAAPPAEPRAGMIMARGA